MRDDITTIPLSEIFEVQEGCPVCRLRDTVESRIVDFVTGAAMMEPDVRVQTNEQGFCKLHFDQMLSRQNKLPVALMLESHLAELDKRIFAKGSLPLSREGYKKAGCGKLAETCYVCGRVDRAMERLLDTLCHTYARESDFRALFDGQPTLCLPHFFALCDTARDTLKKQEAEQLTQAAAALSRNGLTALREDIAWFCQKHDYRNSDKPWGNARDAIERTVRYLTGR